MTPIFNLFKLVIRYIHLSLGGEHIQSNEQANTQA